MPGPYHPDRVAFREFVEAYPDPSPVDLAQAGWVAPGWPPPWGRGASFEEEIAISLEMAELGIDSRAHNPIGIGWAGPTILAAGTPEQKNRFLWPLLEGREFWCQLFSEPSSGSDLSSLSTSARRDGDTYRVSGQKTWNTFADIADWGILLARTGGPGHEGISYFLCPLDLPGITVFPVRQMTGDLGFCDVYFDDVEIAADLRLGAENDGWSLALFTLSNERFSLSRGGVLWGQGPRTSDLIHLVSSESDPGLVDRVVGLMMEAEVMRMLALRAGVDRDQGRHPATAMAIRKHLADRHGQEVMNLAQDLRGSRSLVTSERRPGRDEWDWGFVYSRALTIGGGTTEVLADIIAEQILGLPRS